MELSLPWVGSGVQIRLVDRGTLTGMAGSMLIEDIFGVERALLGMIHLEPLPGAPRSRRPVEWIVAKAADEARLYADAGFHGLIIENMGDRPYLRGTVGPEVVAAMTAATAAVRSTVDLPLGVQVLAGANREALSVALAAGASFVRVEGFVFAHVADEGIIESDAGELLRYRRAIGADHIAIFVDIKKKHSSHALTADVDLVDTAKAAEFFLADGVVVTGSATGQRTAAGDVAVVADRVAIPDARRFRNQPGQRRRLRAGRRPHRRLVRETRRHLVERPRAGSTLGDGPGVHRGRARLIRPRVD